VPGARDCMAAAPLNSTFKLNFCNIRGLHSNFAFVEHHQSTTKPHILALTETQLATDASSMPFNVSNYTLYPSFRFKGGLCVYSRLDLPLTRIYALENPNFDVVWLKVCFSSLTKYLCCLYRSPNSDNFLNLFDYLNDTIEHVISSSPLSEVTLFGDFNVHHMEWLSSNRTTQAGTAAFEFATLNDLQQLIVGPTRIPDNSLQLPSLSPLDLFLTSSHNSYNCKILPPLGNSDHNLISCTSLVTHKPSSSASNRRLWHFASARWDDMRDFYFSFPWDAFAFRSGDPTVYALLVFRR